VPAEFAHSQRHANTVLGEPLAIGGEHARTFVQAARRQGNIGGNTNITGSDVIGDPVVGGIRSFRHGDVTQEWVGRRTQTAIADNGDSQAMPGRHLFDFRFDRTGVAVDKYLKGRALGYQAALSRFLSLPRCQCGREPLRFFGA